MRKSAPTTCPHHVAKYLSFTAPDGKHVRALVYGQPCGKPLAGPGADACAEHAFGHPKKLLRRAARWV
ncbi:hypothetical protein ACFRCW_39800 [Streptomyces sp. NPDC056653]|uniref:hypothetical protein n=1 Tax=Streptomyces sp. NPDC056653 TaxID=3345894 RepID=UPI0036CAAC10